MGRHGRIVTFEDDGRSRRWRRPLLLRILGGLLAVGFLTVGAWLSTVARASDLWVVPAYLAFALVSVGWLVWPMLTLGDAHLELRRLLRRRRRIDLRDVVSAESGYFGISIGLRDGSAVSSSLGETWNLTRWLGRVSRSDRTLGVVLHRARVARGEDVGTRIVLEGRRGAGTWGATIGVLLAALFGHGG